MTSLISAVIFGSASHGALAKADASTGTGGAFVPTQGRVMDTRSTGSTAGTGGYTTPMPAGTWRSVPVAGVAGVPTSGAGAVQVTVTALSPASTGTAQLSADLTTPQGGTALAYGSVSGNISNTAIVALGSNGKIKVEASSSITLLIDVQGYYTTGDTTDGGFATVSPARVVDTRNGTGLPQGQLVSGSTTTITIAGNGGIPANANAVFANITVLNSPDVGYVTAYNPNRSRPTTSLNFESGVTTALGTTVDLSSTGTMALYLNLHATGNATDVIVDVFGYFSGTSAAGGFTPASARVASNVALPASSVTAVQVGGVDGVPTSASSITAVAANMSVAQTGTASGYLRAWASDDTEPSTSNLNLALQPSTISNFITLAFGVDGKIKLRNTSTDALTVTIDVQGWYTNPAIQRFLVLSPDDLGDSPTLSQMQSLQASNAAGGESAEETGTTPDTTPDATAGVDPGESPMTPDMTPDNLTPARSTPGGYKRYGSNVSIYNNGKYFLYTSNRGQYYDQICNTFTGQCKLRARLYASFKENVVGGGSKRWLFTLYVGVITNPSGESWNFDATYYCGVNISGGSDHICGNGADDSGTKARATNRGNEI